MECQFPFALEKLVCVHFPFASAPGVKMSYEPPNIPLGRRCRFGGISPSPSISLSMALAAWTFPRLCLASDDPQLSQRRFYEVQGR
jgi:hypothetical protein